MATLEQYRAELTMTVSELAEVIGIDDQTLKKAELGGRVRARIARQIAEGLSKALDRSIKVQDIEGLNVKL